MGNIRRRKPAGEDFTFFSSSNNITSVVFFTMFFSMAYFLLYRWREKIRESVPLLHAISPSELAALFGLLVSLVYLVGFFGIDFLRPYSPLSPKKVDAKKPVGDYSLVINNVASDNVFNQSIVDDEDEGIVQSLLKGTMSSYSLEATLKDYKRAVIVRRKAVERAAGRSLTGLPVDGFNYEAIYGQCCEMPVGYVQIPVGVVGPLLLDGREYSVPMATTEGCLVASANRGCKAVYVSGGAASVVLKDGMSRAPVVRFGSAKRAAELKFYMEYPGNFDAIAAVFNRSSRFARLQSVKCGMAGKNLYMRFCCSTGDAMGMNMVSKGVQSVLDHILAIFPDMDVIGVSGNYCSDKKPAAINWVEGRGKSVVCEATIKEEVVRGVLKTKVETLVELNTLKNLAGSAVAGSLGGFNAHASNIVTAIFIATGQDPAQNVESSNCITMMEAVNGGKDLHVSVTMPSIEVGTVGGGTQLASQAACLNLLGVKGASKGKEGTNSRVLATIVAACVLAGELSLLSAIAAGQLVNSHLKYNRSSKDITKAASI
ncbi:3-hydroxy-3-methylglutaryl-coenzyme A reductase 1-like [Silene latifolia]|uniref:3-hydroxy-3-methylglutaryl-coenzyme A reductase 1-like n=1 Tax=Silene latifolia TaxID=37657 RepID=UPI003D787D16